MGAIEDQNELNEILSEIDSDGIENRNRSHLSPIDASYDDEDRRVGFDMKQWSEFKKGSYFPIGETKSLLPPGYYDIEYSNNTGFYFKEVEVKTEDLIKFPDHNSDAVIHEINTFWGKEENFKEVNLSFKRGIIMWGPPGSGKSCALQILMRDVIKIHGGVCFRFNNPEIFCEGYRLFRKVQSQTPVIAVLEDLDSIFERYNESEILNLLDGVEKIHKTVFIATTNYPEKLGSRIINRPSRFDKRFKIGYPSEESRRLYLERLFSKGKYSFEEIAQWVEDTDEFTFAHLKELFVAVKILGDKYEEAVKVLRDMKDVKIKSSDADGQKKIGFGEAISMNTRGMRGMR